MIVDAVKEFFDRHQCLPIPGSVPDMKAQSKVYVQLQNIYKAKARKDVAEVLGIVQAAPGGGDVDPAGVELFCKNAAFIKLINAAGQSTDRLPTVVSECQTPIRTRRPGAGPSLINVATGEELANDANAEAMMMPLSLIPIYLALHATSHVATASADQILATINQIVPNTDPNERLREAAEEVARAGGGELHNISALTGGLVAQEMIKIITKQYIPIDNTCIFDGIGSRCQTIRL